MKAQGKRNSHNLLSKDDVMKLYESDMISKEDPLLFLTRLIFDSALVTSWIPGKLYNPEVTDVVWTKHKGVDFYKIANRITTANGSKTAQCGL